MIQGSSTREPLPRCLQYLYLLVKFGNSSCKREAAKSSVSASCYNVVLIWILDLPFSPLADQPGFVARGVR
jgi:hypothetical protein